MMKFTPAKIYSVATAVIVTGLTFASPLYAVPYKIDTPSMPVYAANQETHAARNYEYQTPTQRRATTSPTSYNQGGWDWNVEDRISSLHQQLRITQDQEQQWERVASVMRENDNDIRQTVSYRHQNSNAMNAIQDLQSYQTVAQAHVDGLQRLIPVFDDLYNDMSDAQRSEADRAFNRFEGHMPTKMHK
ncbi:MAG: Spy/CpxP family protein refolding chaperone [Alphaproteobacteria bacterium]|nr:Spy/CpxP family protein refolding chaperone [Alphaproteobacteria bacterium]